MILHSFWSNSRIRHKILGGQPFFLIFGRHYSITFASYYCCQEMCFQPNCNAFEGSVCVRKAADMESLLYYTILYKGVECVWISVFRGSCNQSPIDTEDDCILVWLFAQIFWLQLFHNVLKYIHLSLSHILENSLSLSFQISTFILLEFMFSIYRTFWYYYLYLFLFNIFPSLHLSVLQSRRNSSHICLKVNFYLGLSCLNTYLRFYFIF